MTPAKNLSLTTLALLNMDEPDLDSAFLEGSEDVTETFEDFPDQDLRIPNDDDPTAAIFDATEEVQAAAVIAQKPAKLYSSTPLTLNDLDGAFSEYILLKITNRFSRQMALRMLGVLCDFVEAEADD